MEKSRKSRKQYLGLKWVYILVFAIIIPIIVFESMQYILKRTRNAKVNAPIVNIEKELNDTIDTTIVPKVIGEELEIAKELLEISKLKYEVIEEISDKVENGYILRQEPEYNTITEENSIVRIYVSKGVQ